ncbi:MAG: GHKL domain-containing protein [Lachnospiraceae bacterium]|nr:GHKL domain-containing protein [Lachnospiraceae bacterium]
MIPRRLEILMVVVSEIFLCYWIYWYSKECLGTVGIYRAEMQMLIGLIAILVVDNIFFLLWEKEKVKKIWSVFSIGLLECIICLMIYRWLVLNNEQGIYHREREFLYSVVCLVLFLIMDTLFSFFFRVRKKNAELRKKEEEKAVLEDYNSRLEKLYKEIRGFKHDYINLLSSLYLYIEEENYSDMRTYFLEHILPSGQNLAKEDQAIGKLSNIKQPDIKGLVYLKLINAFHEHLQVQVDLKEEITSIFMESEDLVRVLGIFLDNAIEAAKETEEKYLYLGFLSAEDGVYIRIENSMMEKSVDLTQLCKYGYSTKGNNRGVGLYGVEQILAKYSNVLQSTEQKGKRFVQELKIYRREL